MSAFASVTRGQGRVLFAISGLLACVAIAVALSSRMIGVDQSYLMLITQEVVLGRAHYTQIFDLQPPAGIYLHAPPILALELFKVPIVLSWNLYLVLWCALSACLFTWRLKTQRHLTFWCLWFGFMLIGFDDFSIGQREYVFSLVWFPYLVARLGQPEKRFLATDVLSGALLSFIICDKPSLAAFILLVDVPALLLCKRAQSLIPLVSLFVGGVVQLAHFLLFEPIDQYLSIIGKFRYYETIGLDYRAVTGWLLSTYANYFILVIIAVLYSINARAGRSNRYVVACGATVAVALALAFVQGHPRPYYLIPAILAAVAAALYTLFSEEGPSPVQPRKAAFGWLAMGAVCIVALLQMGLTEGGILRALLKKYLWNQPEYARIGKLPDDQYMAWVKHNVAPNEQIEVIAMQYDFTSAFDPLLSTLRLGRHVNSYAPILQFPLRAALVSKDEKLIDDAWITLIDELTGADWIIVRRTVPPPLEPDLVTIMEKSPRFYDWLQANYWRRDEFGPYVAYQRVKQTR